MALLQRAGGLVTPLLTAVLAFFMGGVVVAATGHNPWKVYKGIVSGTGLPWFIHFGHHHIDIPFTNHHVFFWWDTSVVNNDAYNLQQMLIIATTLTLTGLAVAFAFRCGLFNIGGQGQYLIGVITGLWVGTNFSGMGHVSHVLFAIVVASLAGALWAAIAGFLKATTGAHEVITTIMLNWIAYWLGSWAFGQGGPLPNSFNPSLPLSNDVVPPARAEQGDRGPPVRRRVALAPVRDVHPQSQLRRLPAGACEQPDMDDPGARPALHRRRRPHPLRVARATAARALDPRAVAGKHATDGDGLMAVRAETQQSRAAGVREVA